MKTKPLIFLVLVLVALIGMKLIQSASHKKQVGRTGIESIFTDLPASDISRIAITGPSGDEIVVARGTVGWIVESSYGHPADTAKIDRITAALTDLKGEFRSNKESVLADYALDEAQAIHIRVQDLSGAERTHLLLGNRLTGSSGYFVRKDGDNNAFAAQGNLLGDLGMYGEGRDPESKRFCDLKAFTIDRDSLDRLTLLQEGETLELVKVFTEPAADSLPVDRGSYEWRLDGQPVQKSAADGIAGAVAGIWAMDLLDPALDYGFAEAARRVDLVLEDGSTKRIEFGNTVMEPEAGLTMRIAGQGSVFLIQDNLPTRIFKSREELSPEN
jgi:hypothetical protein